MSNSNKLATPRLTKAVINCGIGKTRDNPKIIQAAEENLALITGQKPKVCPAKQAISGFKIRKGDQVGLMITLRGKRMADFVYKLANIVLPRMRDFRGLSEKNFDQNGNFTLGIAEQIVFPEITPERAEVIHGMSITLVSTAKDEKEGRILLESLGFPFKKES